jgi:hemerythrin
MEWTEERIAVAQLNEQHAELYRVVYALYDVIREGPEEALATALARLREFATGHFAAEERRMAAAEYPLVGGHRAAHEGFVFELAVFETMLSAGGMSATLLLTLSRFVSDWLSRHVAGPDVAFCAFLRGRQAASAAA